MPEEYKNVIWKLVDILRFHLVHGERDDVGRHEDGQRDNVGRQISEGVLVGQNVKYFLWLRIAVGVDVVGVVDFRRHLRSFNLRLPQLVRGEDVRAAAQRQNEEDRKIGLDRLRKLDLGRRKLADADVINERISARKYDVGDLRPEAQDGCNRV